MRFQCPFCRSIVAVDNSDCGIDVQCGNCGEVVTVPYSRVATGSVISDFIILEEIGRGGMGIVYKAHQISLDRPAALKVLSDTYANNAEFVVGFIKEARAAAKLNHPHIVQAYAVGEDDNIFYFAMEYIDGETMKSVLKREGVIPIDQALSIIQQIAEALDYAWKEQRLIHRDIKPDNIMLTNNGRAKLADLGLARVAGELDDSESDEVMGTPQYISPEHLTGAPMDIRSDIYSLGATFFHLITGKFPFEGRSATEIARKHLEEKLRSPREINPDVPEAVCQIIMKMMAKSIKARYQDAEELVDDLRQVRRGKNPSTATGGISVPTSTGGIKLQIRTTKAQKSDGNSGTGTHESTITGLIKSVEESVPTSTGPHSSHSSGTYLIKKMHEEQEHRKKLVLISVIIIGLLATGGILAYKFLLNKPAAPTKTPQQQQAGNNQKTPKEAAAQPEKPKEKTPYILKLEEVIAFAGKNPDKQQEILQNCESFLSTNPEPSTPEEEKALVGLLKIFTPLDEQKCVEPRKVERKKYQEILAEREKKAIEEEKEKQRRNQEAEAKRRAEQERLDAEKRKKEEERQRVEKYREELENMKNDMRIKCVEQVVKNNYSAAMSVFDEATAEAERASSRSAAESLAAFEFSQWAKKYKEIIEIAQKTQKHIHNSGTELANSQIEPKSGSLGRIIEIKDGHVRVKLFNNKEMTIQLEQLPPKQFINVVRKTAGSDEKAAYFLMLNGEFLEAKDISPSSDWKTECSKTAVAYFAKKLKEGSDSEKNEILSRFKNSEELRDAQRKAERL